MMAQTKILGGTLSEPTKHCSLCFVGSQQNPPGFFECIKNPLIDAKMANSASDMSVTFDILDGIIVDEGITLFEILNDDEREEVNNVVTLLECAKDNSLDQFEEQQNATSVRHKHVSEDKLDCLAGKNSAQSTKY